MCLGCWGIKSKGARCGRWVMSLSEGFVARPRAPDPTPESAVRRFGRQLNGDMVDSYMDGFAAMLEREDL